MLDHKEHRETFSREAMLKPDLEYENVSCYTLPAEFLERNKDYVFAYVNFSNYINKKGEDYYTRALKKGYVPVLKEELEPFNQFADSPYSFSEEIEALREKRKVGNAGKLRREQCVEVRDEILMKCERKYVEARKASYENTQINQIKQILNYNSARIESFDSPDKPYYQLPYEQSKGVSASSDREGHPLAHLFGNLRHVEAVGAERFLRG